MNQLPSYFLPRPPMPRNASTLAGFERLYASALRAGGSELEYDLAAPRWQFLCHVADTREVVLHGSTNPSIEQFEPRQPKDTSKFGNQNAVYAASDGIWPLYFAILDRQTHDMSTINASLRIGLPDGGESDPFYFFSISNHALAKRPFRRGTIYLLPRDGFSQEPRSEYQGHEVVSAQWASLEPVRPLARLAVEPEDFPFLAELRGHDDQSTFARARVDPEGFPWVD